MILRFAVAVLMVLHGVAHLVGFVGPWRLATTAGVPYTTTVFAGRVDIGDAGARALGVLWLVVAVAFWIAAAGAFVNRSWWMPTAVGAAFVSLALCFLSWPASRIGVPVNLLILALIVLWRRAVLA